MGLCAGGFTLLVSEVYSLPPLVNHDRAKIDQQISEVNIDVKPVSHSSVRS